MPDYCVFKKAHEVRTVNVARQCQQDALMSKGFEKVCDVVHADNADAALLRYQQLRRDEETAAQSFATDSVVSSLLSLLSR